ncbi:MULTISPECIES: metallophosphoesterase family protein [unclassified Brevundimonas]|uniref:purple acid phosphatase family protein n=1 Tax=unclassified Brevundimonas TaxID=2622653 RepID=UPI0025BAD8D0|nr:MULTISPECIES: metallophosphoesterase family protein [unclassified Brevundimonas]
MKLSAAFLAAAAVLMAAAPSMAQTVAPPDPDPLPPPLHAPNGRWAAKGWADRIVLSPAADAARGAGVAWRTDTRQTAAEAQIAEEIDGPLLGFTARTVAGTTAPIQNENGQALYHQVRFDGLKPDTRYVYRVRAADGWSEWLPFRTAKAEFAPFRFIYLGDTQNDILEIGSRVIRSAFKEAGPAALVVHAGDLVAQREVKVHDDEWGEWTEAGGRAFAMTPQLPATGNHEYIDHILPGGEETRVLGPHWALQFALPDNGAEGVKATSYFVDYQGVRFIVLDGTAALDLGGLEAQTRWLDATLASSPARWNVALFHQPIYTCARPEDTEELKAAWKPIFDARNIDLVLQGHDHCYGRVSNPAGAEASRADSAAGRPQGPVYVVSVTGSKMYGLNDRADTQPVRAAENTELYQLIDVEADRLSFRAFTATGQLYDAFTLTRGADGRNRLTESDQSLLALRRCDGAAGPDDRPCTAEIKD